MLTDFRSSSDSSRIICLTDISDGFLTRPAWKSIRLRRLLQHQTALSPFLITNANPSSIQLCSASNCAQYRLCRVHRGSQWLVVAIRAYRETDSNLQDWQDLSCLWQLGIVCSGCKKLLHIAKATILQEVTVTRKALSVVPCVAKLTCLLAYRALRWQ